MDEMRQLTLRLIYTKGFGVKSFLQLWREQYGGDIIKALEGREVKQLLSSPAYIEEPPCDYLCVWEESYPLALKQIADPPIVLFYLGDASLFKSDAHAIVGTRKISAYGSGVVKQLVESLAQLKPLVVSGMALGTDTLVHEQAIRLKVPTAAVLAGDVLNPSPKQNTQLYKNILKANGLIVSESFPGQQIGKGMFPRRNRVIAGLSRSTTVVEAPCESGALITANLAFDYGRDVYAIPGGWFSANSAGCNQLIANSKAQLLLSGSDYFRQIYPHMQNRLVRGKVDFSEQSLKAQAVLRAIAAGNSTVSELVRSLTEFKEDAILSELVRLEIAGLINKKLDGTIALL